MLTSRISSPQSVVYSYNETLTETKKSELALPITWMNVTNMFIEKARKKWIHAVYSL